MITVFELSGTEKGCDLAPSAMKRGDGESREGRRIFSNTMLD